MLFLCMGGQKYTFEKFHLMTLDNLDLILTFLHTLEMLLSPRIKDLLLYVPDFASMIHVYVAYMESKENT